MSTLDFQRDFTYHASSTTAQVYQDAIVKLDSAMALSDTSTQVLNLARVLKGRALLALDNAAAAAQAVAQVPDGFQYASYPLTGGTRSSGGLHGNVLNQQCHRVGS